MDKLKDILFDVVGDWIDPKLLRIVPKENGYYMVLSSKYIMQDDLKMMQDDLDKALVGTEYEDKVNLYSPVGDW